MLLDTSAIVEIFRSPAESADLNRILAEIGDEEVYISIVQLAETADWATRNRAPAEERVDAVKAIARIVPLDAQICLDAAAITHRKRKEGADNFGLVDGIILGTARSMGQRVLTLYRDFDGENDCLVIP